jgi:hypothetical protein
MNCPKCDSKDVSTKATRKNTSGSVSQRYQCNSCSKWFSKLLETVTEPEVTEPTVTNRWVITSCQNNTDVNEEFCQSLQNYCKLNSAQLLVVPIIYRPDDHEEIVFNIPEHIEHTFVRHKMKIHDEVFVMGQFNFIPTTVNPLQGLESLSKGDTLIVPSPQLRMKSLAVSASRHPAILHTTGAISYPEYTNTKVGEKAKFNHSYSAVMVEIDSDNDFHIRVLNSDESGVFIDLGDVYRPEMIAGEFINPEALVTGDEHATVACPDVESATYTADDSIVRTLKPKYVVRHDILDCGSISHHTRKDIIKNIGKSMFGTNKIEDELAQTVDYLLRTSILPDHKFENIIVASNHTSHLQQWFSSIDIRAEPHNALFYHRYMTKILESMVQTPTGFTHVDPFAQFCKDIGVPNTRFLERDESFLVADVELGAHSDKGTNGSRGSIGQFSNLCDKFVIGHSHTPGIVFGAYQVGTSSMLKLDYTSGLSSWANVHCLVYHNGKRQLIRIVNKKWHA